MANMYHAKSNRERAATKGARFDLEEERVLAEWIEDVTDERRFDQSLFEWLQNGQVLCNMVNTIRPNSVKVGKQLAMKVKKDNINNFILFCVTLGIGQDDMFEPEDLVEMNNTAKVVQGLYRFSEIISRIAPQYAGPKLELPGIFAAYYRGHFKQEAGLGNIHERFAAFQARAPKAAGPPSMGVPQGQWQHFYRQNFKCGGLNAVYKRFGITSPESAKSSGSGFKAGAAALRKGLKSGELARVLDKLDAAKAKGPPPAGLPKGEWPSYYSQSFKRVGFEGMGAIYKRFGVVLREPAAPPPGLLPSMGSFGGPVGKFGGVLFTDEQREVLNGRGGRAALAPDMGSSFLPSMGSFGGPVGKFGGMHSPRSR